MDKENYEQQFMQNIKSGTSNKNPETPSHKPASSLPLVIAIILAIIVLIESIVLIIVLANLFGGYVSDLDVTYEISDDEEEYYIFDDQGDISAFSITCTSDDNSQYSFGKNQQYKAYNAESELLDSGSYSIIRSDIIVLGEPSTNNKTLFYDGANVVDDLVFYECEETL